MILRKIEGNAHLKRDMETNAVLFTDDAAFRSYQNKKINAMRLNILENKMSKLEDKLNTIIDLIKETKK